LFNNNQLPGNPASTTCRNIIKDEVIQDMDKDMDWLEEKIYRDLLHHQRIPRHRQAGAAVPPPAANARLARKRGSRFLSSRQKLAWLMLGLVSGALIVIGAWWSVANESGGGPGGQAMVSGLSEHRASGELPANSFTTDKAGEDLKHGVISRLETLPAPAAGIGNARTSGGKAEDSARNTATSELPAKSDNLPVATEIQPRETTTDTGPTMRAGPLPDDTPLRSQEPAESGDTKRQDIPAMMDATGDGAPKNDTTTTAPGEESAMQADTSRPVVMPIGDSVPKNADKTAGRNQKSAAPGDTRAQNKLAMIATGDRSPMHPARDPDSLQKAAERGDASAQFKLGMMYRIGEDVPENAGTAAEWLEKAAAQGNVDAQYNLGMMYRMGEGVPENSARAAEWFEKAAAQGNVTAQYNLGMMYDIGDGVPIDPAGAVKWLQEAAAQGDAKAQNNLGMMYAAGDGVPKNSAKAADWFRKAAAQRYSDAQFNLGVMYAAGDGVPKNASRAAEWFRMAAEQGDASAQFRLGVMYRIGDGVPRSITKATEWFRKAAAQGDADAQFNLGLMYNKGEGVSRD
jgi:TPR repeat protein